MLKVKTSLCIERVVGATELFAGGLNRDVDNTQTGIESCETLRVGIYKYIRQCTSDKTDNIPAA